MNPEQLLLQAIAAARRGPAAKPNKWDRRILDKALAARPSKKVPHD